MSDGSMFELDEAHADFAATCRSFVDKQVRPLVDDAESSGTFPDELWKQFGSAGMLGLCTPEEFGGSDADSLAVAVLSEELARASGGIAISPLVSAYMAGTHLVRYGSDAQKERWLAPIASGEAVAAIAVSEPSTGSDVAGITSRARTSDDGWLLDGRKMFITNAGLADVLVVGARTGEPGHRGITLFAVEKDTPGLSFSTPLKKMGWHSSDTREVVLDGVAVSRDDVVGAEGRGFYQIMDGFELERIALAGMGIGHAAECLDLARSYVAEREAFGAPLTALQTIRHRLARWRSSWRPRGLSPTRRRRGWTPDIRRRRARWREPSTCRRSWPTGSPTTRCSCSAAPGSSTSPRSPGTTATSACCGSAAARTRSSSRS